MTGPRSGDDWQVLRQLIIGEEAERIARLESDPAEPEGLSLIHI